MTGPQQAALVLDANILVRATLGKRTSAIIAVLSQAVTLVVPDTAVVEARTHLPRIAERRNLDLDCVLSTLDDVLDAIETVSTDTYLANETNAMQRIGRRDPDDWPVLATALTKEVGIWTEDHDFFGTGVATWTTNNVGLFL